MNTYTSTLSTGAEFTIDWKVEGEILVVNYRTKGKLVNKRLIALDVLRNQVLNKQLDFPSSLLPEEEIEKICEAIKESQTT